MPDSAAAPPDDAPPGTPSGWAGRGLAGAGVLLVAVALISTLALVSSGSSASAAGCSAKIIFAVEATAADRSVALGRLRRDEAVEEWRLVSPEELLVALGDTYPAIAKTTKVNPFGSELEVRLRDDEDAEAFVARYAALDLPGVEDVIVAEPGAFCLLSA